MNANAVNIGGSSDKIWYEVGNPPRGYKTASMTEAMKEGKIYKWGEKKVDKIILDKVKKQQQQKYPDLFIDYKQIDNDNIKYLKNKSEGEIIKLIHKFQNEGLLSKLPKTSKFIKYFYDKLKKREDKQKLKEEEQANEYINAIDDAETEEEYLTIFKHYAKWKPKYYKPNRFLQLWENEMRLIIRKKDEEDELKKVNKLISQKDIDNAVKFYLDELTKSQKELFALIENNIQPLESEYYKITAILVKFRAKKSRLEREYIYDKNLEDKALTLKNIKALDILINITLRYTAKYAKNFRNKNIKIDKKIIKKKVVGKKEKKINTDFINNYDKFYREQKDDEEDEEYHADIINDLISKLKYLNSLKNPSSEEEDLKEELNTDINDLMTKGEKWFGWDVEKYFKNYFN